MNNFLAEANAVLFREAELLDARAWTDWLALYAPDCEYWVPSWRNENEATSDPKRELSMIYYSSRAGLEDRVWRVRSGRSVASVVLPRTQHVISNVQVRNVEGNDVLEVCSNWINHQFLPKQKTVEIYFGRYEHTLVRDEGNWLIARKKVLLLNDYLNAKLDFYSL